MKTGIWNKHISPTWIMLDRWKDNGGIRKTDILYTQEVNFMTGLL